MTKLDINSKLKEIILQLHKSVQELQDLYPDKKKKFTLDGRLVGDIGEVVAESLFQIELFEKNLPYYDGTTLDGTKKVQIKATFKDKLTFSHCPDYYIGIKLYEEGNCEIIYNGLGKYIYEHYEHRKGIGENLLSFPIKALREISKQNQDNEKIPMK